MDSEEFLEDEDPLNVDSDVSCTVWLRGFQGSGSPFETTLSFFAFQIEEAVEAVESCEDDDGSDVEEVDEQDTEEESVGAEEEREEETRVGASCRSSEAHQRHLDKQID